jgi:hypothetical protein
MRKRYSTYLLVICFLELVGCFGILTPRQNFISIMNGTIGENIEQMQSFDPGYKDNLLGTKHLMNGNFENKYISYSHLGDCIYVFEIDSKTNKIISWRIEGDPTACIVNP